MKKLLIFVAVSLCCAPSYSQTQRQIDLVTNFFSNYGHDILQDAAHTMSICTSSSVEAYSGHIYYIKLNYKFGSTLFTCEYKLQLDAIGRFIKLNIYSCGDNGGHCFILCSLMLEDIVDDMTTTADRIRYEKYLGKRLEDMSCREYTMVKLFFKWSDTKYYTKY